ncbi:MAG: OmpH family outer membrane protein [Bacteroidota bacterium]|nr:OmpH family outer membrane protein [Bacteroidota bacterium]
MKKGLLIWNVVLTAIAGYLLVVHFGAKNSGIPATRSVPRDLPAANNPLRIAYFEMDSIAASLYIVRDLKEEMNRKQEANDHEVEELRKSFQQKYNYYQSQAQLGNMTAAQSEAVTQEMKNIDETIKNRKQKLEADYNEFVTWNQNAIKTRIEDFLKDYNKDKKYAYIFANEQGLFYFCDTAYNITGDVIKGLNEIYKNKKD